MPLAAMESLIIPFDSGAARKLERPDPVVMNVKVLFDTAILLQDAVNQLLQPLIGSFKATTASIADNSGQTTECYSSVVHNDESGAHAVPVDHVAAVIECYGELTVSVLEAAHRRIKTAKSLRKTDPPEVDNA